jgi:hypothetical protein
MCARARRPIILVMTRPITASKVLLVADRRPVPASRDSGPVRRYRIARLRLESRPAGTESRFEYLKRVYD